MKTNRKLHFECKQNITVSTDAKRVSTIKSKRLVRDFWEIPRK